MSGTPQKRRKKISGMVASADHQEREAAVLAEKAVELEADGRLADAKALARASRHRRVEGLKTRAIAAAKDRAGDT